MAFWFRFEICHFEFISFSFCGSWCFFPDFGSPFWALYFIHPSRQVWSWSFVLFRISIFRLRILKLHLFVFSNGPNTNFISPRKVCRHLLRNLTGCHPFCSSLQISNKSNTLL